MSKHLRIFGLIAVLIPIAASAMATEIIVRKDGTGDFLSINDAFTIAGANDTITVGPGTYAEPFIDVTIPVVLRSELGPDVTIVDGQNTNRIFRFRYAIGSKVDGLTFAFGRAVAIASAGGAIVVDTGANVVIQNCKFHNNTADAGGALYVTQPMTVVTVTDCSFENNDAPFNGGGMSVVLGGVLNVDECIFEENFAGVYGGAVHAGEGSMLNVSGSLFCENSSDDVAGAIYMFRAMGTIQSSTFWRNESPGAISGTVTAQESGAARISRNIIAEDTAGFGIQFEWGVANHDCNVFWNNARGPIGKGSLADDEVVSDPLFCGALVGNFMLSEGSPATESNSACGLLIGAFDVGCGAVAVEESTWGRIKSLYAPDEDQE